MLAVAEVSGREQGDRDHSQSRRAKSLIFLLFVFLSQFAGLAVAHADWSKYHQSLLTENSLNSKQFSIQFFLLLMLTELVREESTDRIRHKEPCLGPSTANIMEKFVFL